MSDYAKISQGVNELSKRDPIPFVLHFGQLDRWVANDKEDLTPVISTSNTKSIIIGEKVKISESLFMKWLKLNTHVDRSANKKIDFHVKNSVENVARIVGYSDRSGLYKSLKPLFEVGLIDLKEGKLGTRNLIDIVVYPYPIYSDNTICNLLKCRDWGQRNSFGFALSSSGINARKNKSVDRSLQLIEDKSLQEVVDKSQQSLVDKCQQDAVDKSLLSNDLNLSNDSNISNDSNHLINRLDENTAKSLDIFLSQEKISEEERLMMIEQLLGFKFQSSKYESHHKYFLKTLYSIRNQKPKKHAVKKDKLPKAFSEPYKVDQQDEDDPETLEAKRQLEQKMLEFKKRSS